jgi:hypothetical protein
VITRYDDVYFEGLAWLNQLAYEDDWSEHSFMKPKRRRCYLAGPMRSKPNFNHPAFDEAALSLRARGWLVYNPAEMDRVLDGHNYLGYSIEEQEKVGLTNARRYAQRDLNIVINELRAEDGDAIVLLPDWEQSIGSNAERAVGIWVGLRILTYKEALEEYYSHEEGTKENGEVGHIISD